LSDEISIIGVKFTIPAILCFCCSATREYSVIGWLSEGFEGEFRDSFADVKWEDIGLNS